MIIKVKDKEFSFEGYVFPINSVQRVAERCYEQGRADAIDEYKKKIEFEYKWLLDCKVFEPNVGIAFNTLISYAEQLKEQNNDTN